MTEYEYEKIEREKIVFAEAEAWLTTNLKTKLGIDFQILGGLKRKGWSYHDVDFALKLSESDPDKCPCKEGMKKLPAAPWLMHGLCLGCGARLTYFPDRDIWRWHWSSEESCNLKERWIQEFADQGIVVDIEFIYDLSKRLETIEKSLEVKTK